MIASLKIFDQMYLMTDGGPNFATRPIIQYIYENGFTNYRIGYASAISYMFFAVIVVVALLQFVRPPGRRAGPNEDVVGPSRRPWRATRAIVGRVRSGRSAWRSSVA